jgi:hypothetical protein
MKRKLQATPRGCEPEWAFLNLAVRKNADIAQVRKFLALESPRPSRLCQSGVPDYCFSTFPAQHSVCMQQTFSTERCTDGASILDHVSIAH